mmetsp:Transcript_22276/g.33796  ORF Transcript_22276/g.33796 Transcript_22276/m.33796 type:complete len:473 (+) Transcript_22276:86-1504(+)
MTVLKFSKAIIGLLALSLAARFVVPPLYSEYARRQDVQVRKLSITLPEGQCIWTHAQALGENANPYGTLFASYPGSGMRVTWQQTEGITGIQVGDDFHLGGPNAYGKTGLVKTQYPHLEGIWSYSDNMDQTILLIRNPRWAIPSYHTFLYEVEYAHDWETAYQYLNLTFQGRDPDSMENWIKWRDYRFEEEMNLWCWFIDFYMENGTQYWGNYDFERNGQWPFRFFNDTEKQNNRTVDPHCEFDTNCYPVALLTYEDLMGGDIVKGAESLSKIADALEGKTGMTLIDRDHFECMYLATFENAPFPNNTNRDIQPGLPREAFTFTMAMMQQINASLVMMKDKYSSGVWANQPIAQELVGHFELYINETAYEIDFMENNPGAPTMEPLASYPQELVEWYVSLGKGNRYDKAKVQALANYWPYVQDLYNDDTTNPYKDTSGKPLPNPYSSSSYLPPFVEEAYELGEDRVHGMIEH